MMTYGGVICCCKYLVINIDFPVQSSWKGTILHMLGWTFPLKVFMSYIFLCLCIFCNRLMWHSIQSTRDSLLFTMRLLYTEGQQSVSIRLSFHWSPLPQSTVHCFPTQHSKGMGSDGKLAEKKAIPHGHRAVMDSLAASTHSNYFKRSHQAALNAVFYSGVTQA